ncbi:MULTISPECIES: hypothetical protein [Microbulbifer]|nr:MULTISPECIES: hypothetical protein [Microbulbifer]
MTRKATRHRRNRQAERSVRIFWGWVLLAGLFAVLLMYQALG